MLMNDEVVDVISVMSIKAISATSHPPKKSFTMPHDTHTPAFQLLLFSKHCHN